MTSRDFRRDITDAVQSGDVAALSAIAYQLLGRVEADDDRRAKQADKKRRERERKAMSATSGMSPDVAGRPGTSGDVATVVPPKRSLTTPPPPSAQVIAKLGDESLQRELDLLRSKYSREEWEDVAAFFLRRKYDRWHGWAKAMLRSLGPASQYMPSDLLQVCRDDELLDRRLGSEHILLQFMGPVRTARLNAGKPPPTTKAGPLLRSRTTPVGTPAPPSDPDVAPKWQT